MSQKHKLCALVCLAMVVLAMIPQIYLWVNRGSDWQGSYSILQGDEPLYSAYTNALLNGRPRRTDPATGEDDIPSRPLPESLFSIQFVPAYLIAAFAKITGVSISTAFIALLPLGALTASLSLFWLINTVGNDKHLAAVGVLIVLCFGALAGGQGLVGLLTKPDIRFLGLPFLRRYEPVVGFPVFFVFCALIWQAIKARGKRATNTKAVLAGLAFAILVFSYFYLWTAAAAWFACLVCAWAVLRPSDRKQIVRTVIMMGVPSVLALSVYGYLLTRLPPSLDKDQVLTYTHYPDLFRFPEIVGAVILGLAFLATRKKVVSFTDHRMIFVISTALMPFLVFNQQILTGRSIQPYHYEILIANYVVLIGLAMIVRLTQTVGRRATVLVVTLCLAWALIEIGIPLRVRSRLDNQADQMVPVLRYLNELAKTDGTWEALRREGSAPTVFSTDYALSRLQPTWAPQGTLIANGSASFQSLPQSFRKEWLFMHLYYCHRSAEYVRQLLNDQTNDYLLAYYAKSTIFGPERALLFLGRNAQPIRVEEIETEVRNYETYAHSFTRASVATRPLTYVITAADGAFDLANIDRWYERDSGERVGAYILYRIKLKN
jgi:hypothetical protein